MEHELQRIRYQSMHFAKVKGLMRCVTEDSLMADHRKQPARKAKGVDGVSKAKYNVNAAQNIRYLVLYAALFERSYLTHAGLIPVRQNS